MTQAPATSATSGSHFGIERQPHGHEMTIAMTTESAAMAPGSELIAVNCTHHADVVHRRYADVTMLAATEPNYISRGLLQVPRPRPTSRDQ